MTTGTAAPSAALEALLRILDLERLEQNLFRGVSPKVGWQRVYGGQVLGQALVAAVRTVAEPRTVHSLHAYFLLAGDPTHPILYEVERIRDGGSFTTRRVKAIQNGSAIFAMSVSFHKVEEGFEHQAQMPDVPGPETLPSARDLMLRMVETLPETTRSFWMREQPVDLRPVDFSRYQSAEPGPSHQYIWLRANGGLPDEQKLHQCVLAYASDFTLLDTALVAHGKLLFDPDIQLASLDHALWFHRPFRADEWLLYAQDSPSAAGARGFCRGSFFTRDGRLVASASQEGLIRRRQTVTVPK
ncbi:MAG: acyl-CoA thioesterase II [Hyphomicrobium sp.]|jgi:acyl-CoA thioesterase-2